MKLEHNNQGLDLLKEKIKSSLLYTEREGMEKVIRFMEGSNYFNNPASPKHHNTFRGGLAVHSWNVYQAFYEANEKFHLNLPSDTIVITALLHDILKCLLYREVNGIFTYAEDKTIWDRGHGKHSLEIIDKFIKLTEQERVIIQMHMGTFGLEYKDFTLSEWHNAIKIYPAVQIFAAMDMAVCQFEKNYKSE